jgi:hypothetical protein
LDQEKAVIRVGGERNYAMTGHDKPAKNATTTITIRPERMVISSPGQGDSPGISGSIKEFSYIGTDYRYVIKILTGQEILIRI